MVYTNVDLVKYAEYQLGNPYWYGTYGNIGSEKLYIEKRNQYPSQYNKWTKTSFEAQYGKKVHDCSGLIKGYMMTPTPLQTPYAPAVYNPKYDFSANGMIEQCKEQGPISLLPEVVGLVLWKNNHVGIYIGNGRVIEAKGHAYGVIKSKLTDTKWVRWGKLPFIEYVSTPKPEEGTCMVELDVLKKGMKNSTPVRRWQTLLNGVGMKDQNGNALEVDGSFGGKTEYATKEWQKKHKLTSDGVVGSASWTKMIEG